MNKIRKLLARPWSRRCFVSHGEGGRATNFNSPLTLLLITLLFNQTALTDYIIE